MKGTPRKIFVIGALASTFGIFSPLTTRQASAVVLQQKWQNGQTSTYNLTFDGIVSVKSSDQMPVPWAGMPLSVPVNGSGILAFDTLGTNAAGNATVRTRVPQMQIHAAAFGMKADLSSKDSIGTFSLNGAPGKTVPLPMLSNPAYGVLISPLGQITGIENLSVVDKTANNSATMQKWLSAMPQLWPSRDLKAGDSWTVTPKMPLDTAPGGNLEFGDITMKLVGEETVGGAALQHVALSGTLLIDAAKAALLNAKMTSTPTATKGTARLVSDSKTLNGDVWFDAAQGRIARMTLKTVASNAMSGRTKLDAAGKSRDWTSTQGFNGTFQLQLN